MESTPDISASWELLRPLKRLALSWLSCFEVVLHPVAVILLGSTIGLISFQASQPDLMLRFSALGPLITTLSAISAGIAGAFLENRWRNLSEGGVLVTRGKSAIRGLTLLLQNLGRLERRVATHLVRARDAKADAIITTSYEEVIGQCTALEEEAVNSIEEWQDIIPEANVKTQIGMISALKADLETFTSRISDLQNQLAENKTQSKGSQEALQKQLEDMRARSKATIVRLKEAESRLNSSPLSGLTGFQATGSQSFGFAPFVPNLFPKVTLNPMNIIPGLVTCPHCGHLQARPITGLCSKCGKSF